MSQANKDAPTSHARRRFIRAAGMALGGGLGGLAQEWFGLSPAGLGPVAAGVTGVALLWHLGTSRASRAGEPRRVVQR